MIKPQQCTVILNVTHITIMLHMVDEIPLAADITMQTKLQRIQELFFASGMVINGSMLYPIIHMSLDGSDE